VQAWPTRPLTKDFPTLARQADLKRVESLEKHIDLLTNAKVAFTREQAAAQKGPSFHTSHLKSILNGMESDSETLVVMLNLTEDVADVPLSALALCKTDLDAKNMKLKVLSVYRNDKRYNFAKAQFEDHLMSSWLAGTVSIDGLLPFNRELTGRPPAELTSDVPFIDKVKMSPSELNLNVCTSRHGQDGETFYDIDDVNHKMWDIAADGFRSRYNQLRSEFSAKFGSRVPETPAALILTPGIAGNPDPVPNSLSEVLLSSLQSTRKLTSGIVNLQILHTDDGIYVANESAENIQVPKKSHLGGVSSGSYVLRTSDLPTHAIAFDFPAGDATIVQQEECGSSAKVHTLSLYNCLRTWQETQGLTQLKISFFKDPERKLSADTHQDSYALTKESDRVHVHDEKVDKAPFDNVPFSSLTASEHVAIAFRLRLVKAGLGKAIVKPRKPCLLAKAGFVVKAKHAVRVISF